MTRCFVPGCANTQRNTRGIPFSFHRFPKSIQKEWLVAIGRDPKIHISNHVVCQDHFNKDDFYAKHERRILKLGVTPSQNVPCRPKEDGTPLSSQKNITCVEPSSSEVQEIILIEVSPDLPSSESGSSSKSRSKQRKLQRSSSPSSSNSTVQRQLIRTFHNYSKPPDVDILRQRNRILTNHIKLLTMKLKKAQQTNAKRKKKIKTLLQIINESELIKKC